MNSLLSKLEIGAPMAAMYLLGNPDYYTSHKFVGFYWRQFTNRVMATADNEEIGQTDDEVYTDPWEDLVPEDDEEVIINRSGDMANGSDDHLYDMDDEQYEFSGDEADGHCMWDLEEGHATQVRKQQMHEASQLLNENGWTEKLDPIQSAFIFVENVSPEEWRQRVDDERAKVLKSRFADIIDLEGKRRVFVADRVAVLPGSYISQEYAFATGDIKKAVEQIASEFTLNEEQRRAFRIVTNHSLEPARSQLLMYLGGMAGVAESGARCNLIGGVVDRQQRSGEAERCERLDQQVVELQVESKGGEREA
ncbi:hypothetical protein BKA70DRAFT_1126321 [Coprinopsis sp. MPI-PUGE-AT-0042]|nr:hypothetical protein BKA70DRAFT_1126321 [Coprinopsis sp. MPI-PUGE-AT-0042]